MISNEKIFEYLWKDYCKRNPHAHRIHALLQKEGETLVNDHIALRTFNDKRVNIDFLMQPFVDNGYVACADYDFPVKKLFARHYEKKNDPQAPRIFISELLTEKFSPYLQKEVKKAIDGIPKNLLKNPTDLLFSQRPWPSIAYATYEKIEKESEFAAWLLAYGYGANHFTISINQLKRYNTIEKINRFVTEHGYTLNSSGGVVKGSPELYFEQSSTMAGRLPLEFSDGMHEATTCYYEFAKRYKQPDGSLFSGFIVSSADKIFESTNR